MTKRTYREIMEAMREENAELKRRLKELQAPKPDVYDTRSLDHIIDDYREEKKNDAPQSLFMIKNAQNESSQSAMSGFMEHYREYRKLQAEQDNSREMEILLDTSALAEVKNILKRKPA